MTNLEINKSYHKVIEDINKWYKKILFKLDYMYDNILNDMNKTFDHVHYFASFTNILLIEHEKQLEKATTNEEIDIIQERLDQILSEVQLLQTLSFHLNSNSVKLIGELHINYNNHEIKFISNLFNNTYRFLITRSDAIELEKHSLSFYSLTSYENKFINECVLTFNVLNLDSFLNVFNIYWNIFPNNNEIRMLLTQNNISFIIEQLGQTSQYLLKRFQLNQMKTFNNLCPKSDEKILLINGTERNLIKDCIEEIYFNIEEENKNKFNNQNIKLYDPNNLTNNDIDEIIMKNIDYGGFLQNRNKSININQSRLHIIEDEENTDEDYDDLWDENDDWWNFQHKRDNNIEAIQREMIISSIYAGVIIGLNASRIDQIKQKTGAYVYINGESSDLKRTVFIKGTREQVDRAYGYIEKLIERYKNNKLLSQQRRLHEKHKKK